MSKHASPTIIGAFVLTALVLVVAGILIIGGGRYFRDTARVIVYFDSSVAGLRVGAPVKFRGIEIGTVKDIRINMTGAISDPKNIRIPVLLEIDEDRLTAEGVPGVNLDARREVERLVALGLRAQLDTESFVTGVRYVALDIKPGTPAYLVHDRHYPEIPSLRSPYEAIPAKVEQLLANLTEVEFSEIGSALQSMIAQADHLLASPDLARAVAGLDDVTAALRRSIHDISRTTRDLAPVIAELKEVATAARKTVAPAGQLTLQVDATLRDVQVAARSLRRLTDQLSRDPGAIVRGGKQ